MKFNSLLKAAAATIALASPATAQNFNWSSMGITVPQQGAQYMCDKAPSDDAFNSFHCPKMAEAMWWADPSMLQGISRAEQFAYISAWITAVHEPSVVWKVDPSVYSQLDPRLPMHVRYLLANNTDVLGGVAGEGLGILMQAIEGFVGARKQAVANGTLDPIGEMQGWLGGAANAPKPVTLAGEIANHDVMAWIGLAQRDPDAAIQLYQGMRAIAINF
jgi:hypothetical protein